MNHWWRHGGKGHLKIKSVSPKKTERIKTPCKRGNGKETERGDEGAGSIVGKRIV